MKKLLTIAMSVMFVISAYAQNDVTKFLGIPVDGTKSEMIRKLKDKGFVYDQYNEYLAGEFNGMNVHVYIATNNNKVCRIMVCDEGTMNEIDIRIRFNTLCRQFENNPKYGAFGDYSIPNDEDISYEITVHKKRYNAAFYQKPTIDETKIENELKPILLSKYTEEQLENPTEEIQADIIKLTTDYIFELYSKMSVWFMISEFRGEYYITMFYDNEYNRANGENL